MGFWCPEILLNLGFGFSVWGLGFAGLLSKAFLLTFTLGEGGPRLFRFFVCYVIHFMLCFRFVLLSTALDTVFPLSLSPLLFVTVFTLDPKTPISPELRNIPSIILGTLLKFKVYSLTKGYN